MERHARIPGGRVAPSPFRSSHAPAWGSTPATMPPRSRPCARRPLAPCSFPTSMPAASVFFPPSVKQACGVGGAPPSRRLLHRRSGRGPHRCGPPRDTAAASFRTCSAAAGSGPTKGSGRGSSRPTHHTRAVERAAARCRATGRPTTRDGRRPGCHRGALQSWPAPPPYRAHRPAPRAVHHVSVKRPPMESPPQRTGTLGSMRGPQWIRRPPSWARRASATSRLRDTLAWLLEYCAGIRRRTCTPHTYTSVAALPSLASISTTWVRRPPRCR